MHSLTAAVHLLTARAAVARAAGETAGGGRMRRPRRRLEVSTFPFLAVLLCAMGSLILLLLVLDRRAKAAARARAEESARAALAERGATARAAAEAAARRAEERAAERERRRAALHEQLARASGRGDGSAQGGRGAQVGRRPAVPPPRPSAGASCWKCSAAAARSWPRRSGKPRRSAPRPRRPSEMSESARKEAARLSAQLRGLEVVLDELKAARKRDAQTYSLMPYRGKRGDGRRPLYLECTADGSIFHPDRKTLSRHRHAAGGPQRGRGPRRASAPGRAGARGPAGEAGVPADAGAAERHRHLLRHPRCAEGQGDRFRLRVHRRRLGARLPRGRRRPRGAAVDDGAANRGRPGRPVGADAQGDGAAPGRVGGVDDFGEGDANGFRPGARIIGPAAASRHTHWAGFVAGWPRTSRRKRIGWCGLDSRRVRDGRSWARVRPAAASRCVVRRRSAWSLRSEAPPGGTGGSGSGGSSAVALMPGGSRPGSGLSPQSGGTGVPGAVPLVGGASGGNGVSNPDGTMPGNSPPTPGGGSGTGQAGGTPGVAGTAGGTSGIPGSAGGTPGVPGSAGWTKQVPGTGGGAGQVRRRCFPLTALRNRATVQVGRPGAERVEVRETGVPATDNRGPRIAADSLRRAVPMAKPAEHQAAGNRRAPETPAEPVRRGCRRWTVRRRPGKRDPRQRTTGVRE